MAALGEMLKRRPLRKSQSLDEHASKLNIIPPSHAITDARISRNSSNEDSPQKRKGRTISEEGMKGASLSKMKNNLAEDHSDALFVTALECSNLAPFVKEKRGLFSSERNAKEVQVEGSIHLAFQLNTCVRRSDDICVAGMTDDHNIGGTGQINEEFVYDIPGGTVALQVSCLMRQYPGRKKTHCEKVIGYCLIPLDRLPELGHVEQWYSFKNPVDDSSLKAAVKLKLKLVVSTLHDPLDTPRDPEPTGLPPSNVPRTKSSSAPSPLIRTTSGSSSSAKTTSSGLTSSGSVSSPTTSSPHMLGGMHKEPSLKPMLTEKTLSPDSQASYMTERSLSSSSIDEEEDWWCRQVVTSGLVDFIAIVRGGASVLGSDGVLRPEACVTERWPEGDTADGAEFPQKVEWFCFPGGWVPMRGNKKKHVEEYTGSNPDDSKKPFVVRTEKPFPRIETFAVQLDAARAWGVCLVDHELSVNSDGEWWWPVGTCLLTRLPIVESLKLWLSEFYYYLNRNSASHHLLSSMLAPHFMQLLVTVPRPVDNILAIRFDPFGPESRRIVVDVAAPHGLPPFGFNLHASIKCLGAKALVQLMAAALGERKMLMHSSDMSTITPLAEAVCCLLYPLQWSHAYVPVLPRVMIELLEAPQPYIVGIHSSWLSDIHPSSLEDVVIIDIDRGSVEAYEDTTYASLLRDQEAREALEADWDSTPPPQNQPSALPESVEENLRLLLSDYLIQGDLPLDDANAPLFAPSSSEAEVRVGDVVSRGSKSTPIEISVRCDSAASVQLRLACAAQFAILLAGFEQCVFWVDAGWPVFDESRFLEDYTHPIDQPALTQLVATQTFQQLLENFEDPDLAPFHSFVQHVDIDAKRTKGCGVAGLAAARHSLSRSPLDPGAPSSRVAAIARAARFKIPAAGSGGCCRHTLVVPYVKLDEHKRARSRWSSATGARLKKGGHSMASDGAHRCVGFPSENLILVSCLDDAVNAMEERSKAAFESARSNAAVESIVDSSSDNGGAGRFRWKAEPPPLPEDATVWTVGNVADQSGAPVSHLVQPPIAELDFDHDMLVGAEEFSLAVSRTGVKINSSPGPLEVSEAARNTRSKSASNIEDDMDELGNPIKKKSNLFKGDVFDTLDIDEASAPMVKPRTPTGKAQRRGSLVASNLKQDNGSKSDDEKEEELTYDEQQLIRCVALALSAPEGPPASLLSECEESISREPALGRRLVKVLTRMRKHASMKKPPPAGSAAAAAAVPHGIAGFRLPQVGFETLATLCNAVLKSCAQRKEYDPPYTLLRLTGAYYQRLGNKDAATVDEELEYLSSRLCENHIFSDLGLWQFVLSKDIKTPPVVTKADETALSVSDKRAVVQRVTLLLYSMRGIGMTPHRAVMLVRSVVSSYALSQRQWRQLHGVVCTAWKDAALPEFNKLGFVSSASFDEDRQERRSVSPSRPRDGSLSNTSQEDSNPLTPIAARKFISDDDDKWGSYGDESEAVGNCNFLLGNKTPVNRRRSSYTMKSLSSEEMKDERETQPNLSEGDAVLPLTTSESVGTITCASIWGDKGVFGGTDCTVRCLQLPYAPRLPREESIGGASMPNLEVIATHSSAVTAIKLLDPYVVSGDALGTLKVSFPFDESYGRSTTTTGAGLFSSNPKSPSSSSVTTLLGHTTAITCIGVPRNAGGGNGPVENIPSPGLSVPLIATGTLDGCVRIWNLSMAREEKNPSSWAIFDPPKPSQQATGGFVSFHTNKTHSGVDASCAVRSLQLDSWGRSFASGSNDSHVRLSDIETETIVGEVHCHTAAVRAVRFKGGNNNRVLSCSNDRTACLTDPRTHGVGSNNGVAKESISTAASLQFQGHGAPVTCLDEGNESDPIFFTGSADTRIMVWDARTSKLPLWIWEAQDGTVVSLRSFGKMVVSASENGSVCEWDVTSGRLLKRHKCTAPIGIAESSGGRFVTATWAQRLHIFSFADRRASAIRSPGHFSPTSQGNSLPPPSSAGKGIGWSPTIALNSPPSTTPDSKPPSPKEQPLPTIDSSIIPPPPPLSNKHYGIAELEVEEDESHVTTSPLVSKWEKLGGKPLFSVTEDDEEEKPTTPDLQHQEIDLPVHRPHKPIQPKPRTSSLTVDIEAEAYEDPTSTPKTPSDGQTRTRPRLKTGKSGLTPRSDDDKVSPRLERAKPRLNKTPRGEDSSTGIPKLARESSLLRKEQRKEKDKKALMETLTKGKRSKTPKRIGLASEQRVRIVKESSSRLSSMEESMEEQEGGSSRSIPRSRSNSPRIRKGATVVRSRSPRLSPARSPRKDSSNSPRVPKEDSVNESQTRRMSSTRSPRKYSSNSFRVPKTDLVNEAQEDSFNADSEMKPVEMGGGLRPRSDSASSDIAEMATGLEAFLKGAKLTMHLAALNEHGVSELLHLEVAEDSMLVEIGFKKPEIKRLRRYLKKVQAL